MGSSGKAPVWGLGTKSPEADAFFVNKCLNVDVLKEKFRKTAKYTIINNYGQLKGGEQAQAPPP